MDGPSKEIIRAKAMHDLRNMLQEIILGDPNLKQFAIKLERDLYIHGKRRQDRIEIIQKAVLKLLRQQE